MNMFGIKRCEAAERRLCGRRTIQSSWPPRPILKRLKGKGEAEFTDDIKKKFLYCKF
jgi:hypothetical protein